MRVEGSQLAAGPRNQRGTAEFLEFRPRPPQTEARLSKNEQAVSAEPQLILAFHVWKHDLHI